jgi:response regulator RpfG family c-di-GMP phosphodiesterase
MRLKILLIGENPLSLVSDGQLLRDRGLLVFTAFNLDNVPELIKEIKPDVIFFDPHKENSAITEMYNNVVNSIYYTNIPVIYTLSEDDVYLITRKRTTLKEKRTIIADNIIDAIKMALKNTKVPSSKKTYKVGQQIPIPFANARA